MSTIIYPSPIFGPVHSRRLGLSLGINLLPADGKVCTFDCVYCECGFNVQHRPKQPMPTREAVAQALEQRLQQMKAEGRLPDVLTFAGNGEPTCHPRFADIIGDTILLRDRYCPEAKVSVLSNATQLHRPDVHQVLARVDNNIQKLDTIAPDYIRLVDQPAGHYDVQQVISHLKAFNGHVIIQTMFMQGSVESGEWKEESGKRKEESGKRKEESGKWKEESGEWKEESVDNTGDEYVLPWLDAVADIRPQQVMVYTIDRETPTATLHKATSDQLDRIAALVRQRGIDCSVSY